MKVTGLFTKTQKTAPADEVSRGAALLIRAGYIHKEMAGVYDFLPLGRRVLQNIVQVIRAEMDALGGQELSMTALQSKTLWEASDRWDDKVMDVWFKTKLNAGGEVGLAPTHEEPLTALMRSYIASYKDLPVYVYQFQTKFRNELRAKSGIMRTREFLMKDLYSFSRDRQEHERFYEKTASAYLRIFDRLGLGDRTYRTFASGGSFSKFSDEFQTVCDAGEDVIYVDPETKTALNEEVLTDENLRTLGLDRAKLRRYKSAEVGNIFTLGTKYSSALKLFFTAEDGSQQPVFMGSYGIGPSRVMGVIAELLADDKGLVWPDAIAPYRYYLVALSEKAQETALKLHNLAPEAILYDDRTGTRAGVKFADAELLGLPWRIVVSEKTLADDAVELTDRRSGHREIVKISALTARLSKNA